MGYSDENAALLEAQLLTIARFMDVTETMSTPYGTKYVVSGALHTPIGSMVRIKTVWIVDAGDDQPRFVTAYPA